MREDTDKHPHQPPRDGVLGALSGQLSQIMDAPVSIEDKADDGSEVRVRLHATCGWALDAVAHPRAHSSQASHEEGADVIAPLGGGWVQVGPDGRLVPWKNLEQGIIRLGWLRLWDVWGSQSITLSVKRMIKGLDLVGRGPAVLNGFMGGHGHRFASKVGRKGWRANAREDIEELISIQPVKPMFSEG